MGSSKICKWGIYYIWNLKEVVGAERINCCFYSVRDGVALSLPNNFQKVNWGGTALHTMGGQLPFCDSFVNICMSWMNVSSESHWRRILLSWCHTCSPGERQTWLRFCLRRLCVMPSCYFVGSLVKVYYVPSEVKANCNWEAVEKDIEQNILAKSIVVKYLSVADWMESVISIILGYEVLMVGA